MLIQTVRETSQARPEVSGNFDGVTRAGALAALLDAHKTEVKKAAEPKRGIFATLFGGSTE